MEVKVNINIKEVQKELSDIHRNQLPYAVSLALNATANDVAKQITDEMPRYLDRPNPFTLTAFMTKAGRFRGTRARKTNLRASIIPGEIQEKYLAWQVYGGKQLPKKQAILVPTLKAPKDRYGNISRATRKKYAKPAGNLFHAGQREDKEPGVYRRTRKKVVEMLAAYEPFTEYQPRFPMYKIAQRSVNRNFSLNMTMAIRKAIQTAR
jgi:hypothetical protein